MLRLSLGVDHQRFAQVGGFLLFSFCDSLILLSKFLQDLFEKEHSEERLEKLLETASLYLFIFLLQTGLRKDPLSLGVVEALRVDLNIYLSRTLY